MILLLAAIAAAAGPGDGRGVTCVVKIQDPRGSLHAAPEVGLVDSSGGGSSIRPTDDGEAPDAIAGDGVYSATADALAPGEVRVTVTDGASEWTGTATLAGDVANPEIALAIAPEGLTDMVRKEPGAGPRAPVARVSGGPGQPEAVVRIDPWHGVWLWFVLFAAFGAGAGALAARTARRAPWLPALDPPLPEPGIPPRRVSAEHTGALLAGPLAGRALLVLGPVPEGSSPARRCPPGVLPVELVRAAEEVAVREGGRVALLVTDPAQLEAVPGRSGLDDLARAVGGRFELWAVGGPKTWEEWRPPPEPPHA